MKALALFCFTTLLLACNNDAAKYETTIDTVRNQNDTMKYGDMKTYWLVFLKTGPDRSQDSATAARIQAAHLNNIDRLAKEGKIIMAGPMAYKTLGNDLRGIFVMDASDSAEAASYIKTDSAIISGRLRFEIHPWMFAKGKYEFK